MFKRSELTRIYLLPLWLTLLSIAGLVLALLGDGLWDLGAWLLLSLACLACFYQPLKKRVLK